MPHDVFSSVATESRDRRGYDPILHHRVHSLVDRWLASHGEAAIPYGADDTAREQEIAACTEWVISEYRECYGVPLVGFLLWPVFSGIISWLVQRTLERMFPRGTGQAPSSSSSS